MVMVLSALLLAFSCTGRRTNESDFLFGTRLREQCEEDHDLGYELMKRMAAIIIERLQATRKQLVELQRLHS